MHGYSIELKSNFSAVEGRQKRVVEKTFSTVFLARRKSMIFICKQEFLQFNKYILFEIINPLHITRYTHECQHKTPAVHT